MKTIQKVLAATLLAAALLSCSNEPYFWKGETYARLTAPSEWSLGTDSVSFTFSVYPEDIKEFTLDAQVSIIGLPSDSPRTVAVKVDPERTTALEGVHFEYPGTVTVASGEHSAAFPILLKRTQDIADSDVRVRFIVTDDGDIKTGIRETNALTVKFNDKLSKPSNWDVLEEFFGDYSLTKYRYIITVTGVAKFTYGDAGGMSWGEMYNYRLMMVSALDEYNKQHPGNPMKDEDGVLITF